MQTLIKITLGANTTRLPSNGNNKEIELLVDISSNQSGHIAYIESFEILDNEDPENYHCKHKQIKNLSVTCKGITNLSSLEKIKDVPIYLKSKNLLMSQKVRALSWLMYSEEFAPVINNLFIEGDAGPVMSNALANQYETLKNMLSQVCIYYETIEKKKEKYDERVKQTIQSTQV